MTKKLWGGFILIFSIPSTVVSIWGLVDFTKNWNALYHSNQLTATNVYMGWAILILMIILSIIADVVGYHFVKQQK